MGAFDRRVGETAVDSCTRYAVTLKTGLVGVVSVFDTLEQAQDWIVQKQGTNASRLEFAIERWDTTETRTRVS